MAKKSSFNLLNFRPARLSEAKDWRIVFYVENPSTGEMERHRMCVRNMEDVTLRRKYAKKIIQELNFKLFSGWTPYGIADKSENIPFSEAIQIFLDRKQIELRNDSMRSYRSYCKSAVEFAKKQKIESLPSDCWTSIVCSRFMDFVIKKKVSGRTHNNYLIFMSNLFAWMVEHGYARSNNFKAMRKMKTDEKNREPIPPAVRTRIIDHLEKQDYNFLIVCQLVFHTLIRPKEVTMLRPRDFELKNQIIRIQAKVSKNRKQRIVTIPNSFMPYLAKWDFNNAKLDECIFGENFRPGKDPVNSRRLAKKWDKLRRDLRLPEKYKLYSLRDSGIIQMLNDGISPNEVMKQADHSSLDITTIYIKHVNPEGSEQIKNKSSGFNGQISVFGDKSEKTETTN